MTWRGVALSEHRRSALCNGAIGMLEYLAQPLGLLLSAPYLLRHLGSAQFGVWVLAGAAVNGGNTISSGFGDAAIRFVAMYRGCEDRSGVEQAVRVTLAINLVLGGAVAIAIWLLAPFIAIRAAHGNQPLAFSCTASLRIGSLLLVVRSVDSVLGCTLRAFERYAPAASIATAFRFAVLAAAVALSAMRQGVVAIMAVTLLLALLSVAAQGFAVRAIAGRILLLPSFARQPFKQVLSFGVFSWLQGISAIAFTQADRLAVGVIVGATAVAQYGLCAQAAQSIHGTIAAGFHWLFPHLSRRLETDPPRRIGSAAIAAGSLNVLLAALAAAACALFSRRILSLWMGPEFAQQAAPLFATMSVAYGLFAMNVTAHYVLLALGRVRLVTALNLAAAVSVMALMIPLATTFGSLGAACARLIAGPITCLLYLPLAKQMRIMSGPRASSDATAAWENA